MKPLTADEARDLARVVGHPQFEEIVNFGAGNTSGRWKIAFRAGLCAWAEFHRRTLRSALRAAVRWIEEQP